MSILNWGPAVLLFFCFLFFFVKIFLPVVAAEIRCSSHPDRMEALKTRLPSRARAAEKVAEPLVRGWAPAWGCLLWSSGAPAQMLPVRAAESSRRRMEPRTQLLSAPAATAGLWERIFPA